MRFAERAGLDAAMSDIVAAPQSEAAIDILCCRPEFGERTYHNQITVTRDYGILVERWLTAPWRNLPGGSPDPAIQVSILAARVYKAVVVKKQNMLHPGDTIISDLDCSEQNMLAGAFVLRVPRWGHLER